MCEPTAIAIGSLAMNAGSAVAGAGAQNKQAKANKANALEALRLGTRDVNARLREETAAASQQEQQVLAAGAAGLSTAQTSAVENGVGGQSVDALVAEVLRQQGAATDTIAANLDMLGDQAERQKQGLVAEANSRIAGTPPANPLATGLGVAGAGLSFLNTLRLQRGPSEPKAGKV
jgi:hypothetical protein